MRPIVFSKTRSLVGVAVLLASVIGVTGCSFLIDSTGLVGGAVDAGSDVTVIDGGGPLGPSDSDPADDSRPADGADTGPDGSLSVECLGTAGPVPVKVAAEYCIDATEVTGRQYNLFLDAASEQIPVQHASCGWNDTFVPVSPHNDVTPVFGVDWCDAWAYCHWAGKRLCGRLGGTALDTGLLRSAELDEWHRACSKEGTQNFPYSGGYDADACNGPAKASAGYRPLPVGTQPGCEGGYPGIFDMGGNLWEWIDSCNANAATPSGQVDECAVRGGSFASDNDLSCGVVSMVQRDRGPTANDLTIRCCSDAR